VELSKTSNGRESIVGGRRGRRLAAWHPADLAGEIFAPPLESIASVKQLSGSPM
jgi:hypothetical protein